MINLTTQRYNIALIPENKTYYESLSKRYFDISEYKVGHTSIPHITIAQFYEDRETVVRRYIITSATWQKPIKTWNYI